MLLLLPCPDHYRVGIKAGPSLVGMTLTEHTALMTARLVSSGAGPVLRCVRPTRSARPGSSHAGYLGAGPTSGWVSTLAVGVAVLDGLARAAAGARLGRSRRVCRAAAASW
jgi:hypothetical protein